MFLESCKKLEAAIDTDLKDYFIQTSAIHELDNFQSGKVLAVGLKGIGKTAAYRYFTEFETKSDIVIGINSEKYTLHLPRQNLHYETCRKQFQHDLVIETLREVQEKRKLLLKKVENRILDDAKTHLDSYMKKIKDLAGRFGGISVLGCGFTLNKGNSPVLVGLRKEKEIAEAYNVLSQICTNGVKIRIVIDDPEKVFSASRDLDTHLIGGLCLAALRLSQSIPRLKIVILLKTHVYYSVLRDVDDLFKYMDHMSRLSWKRSELVQIINRRLEWTNSNWKSYFQGSEKQAKKLLESMCLDLRNGPRDLLRWIALCIETAKGSKIDQDIVKKAKEKMSSLSLSELEAANSSDYPKIGAVIGAIFRYDPAKRYTLKDLKAHILNLLIIDTEMKKLTALPWMQLETSQTLPELLFKVGSVDLKKDDLLILPYEENYDTQNFESADSIGLVRGLMQAMK